MSDTAPVLTITDPNGVAYRLSRYEEEDRYFVMARRLDSPNTWLNAWVADKADHDALHSMIATLIARGDYELIPAPRWRVLIDRAWRWLTGQPTYSEEWQVEAERWMPSSRQNTGGIDDEHAH